MFNERLEGEIRHITDQLVAKYRPEKIILFGSGRTEGAGIVNDLDFLIVKRDVPDQGRERSRAVRRLISKQIAADFLVYRPEELEERARLCDPFVLAILREGRILYG